MTKPFCVLRSFVALLGAGMLLGACYGPGPNYPAPAYWRPTEGPYSGPGPYDGPEMYRDMHH